MSAYNLNPFTVTRKALHAHRCDWAGDVIEPGELYVDEAWPPWTLMKDDPDGYPFKTEHWYHERSHIRCRYP